MLGYNDDKKLVKRPDTDPKFNPRNPTDKKILLLVLLGLGVTLLIATGLILLYFFVIRG